MTIGRVIAIVGAESTGKTTLAGALAARIANRRASLRGRRRSPARMVRSRGPHAPRGRTDGHCRRAAATHRRRRGRHDVVVADTTPLMIAMYSQLLFDDASLVPMAMAAQRQAAVTLLTALDLPWVADGHQRDGEHVREPVDGLLRSHLAAHDLGWSVVGGQGEARVEQAFDAVSPLLAMLAPAHAGLFTRLAEREAAMPAWRWVCEKCDMPDCEHAALRAAQGR